MFGVTAVISGAVSTNRRSTKATRMPPVPASVPLGREYPNFVTHLECSFTGTTYPKQVVHSLCTCCSAPKPLLVVYDLPGIRASITKDELRNRSEPGFWKYREFLPVESTRNVASLGEVITPLIKLGTYNPGGGNVLVKDEVRRSRSLNISHQVPPLSQAPTC